MSNVIDLLERMGQDAGLRHASLSQLELMLEAKKVEPELRAAILDKDQARLKALLGQTNVCCLLLPSKEDEDDDSEESPSRENEEAILHFTHHVLAKAVG